ncbi:MAG: hypothetical protein HY341_02145, partial [Candidatus Kerfeldbacteria bacterium]|nr:hypothetical protein [Candidatus Kerfeldbacteria bacterium]
PIADLRATGGDRRTTAVAGIITKVQKVLTRAGDPMLFVKLEDLTGGMELLVFPKVLAAFGDAVQEDRIVRASGKLSAKEGEVKLLCDTIEQLQPEQLRSAPARITGPAAQVISITIPYTYANPAIFEKLKDHLRAHPGKFPVHLRIASAHASRVIETQYAMDDTAENRRAIEDLIGANAVSIDKGARP